MYSTCLFCNQSLGTNEVVEVFPVGRRLAFDQRQGRLWVVCRKCMRWNLTPLEERWEAIETCERLFRGTRTRASTDQIGLARLPEGLELVRIGMPLRPEFAAWRYGDQVARRRRRTLIVGSVIGVAGAGALAFQIGGLIAGGGVAATGSALYQLMNLSHWAGQIYQSRRTVARLRGDEPGNVRGRFVHFARLIPTEDAQQWGIEVPVESRGVRRRVILQGSDARRIASTLLPRLTPGGGPPKAVRAAVELIEGRGDPQAYLAWLARHPWKRRDFMRRKDIVTGVRALPGHAYDSLAMQGRDACLAVEMAVNEEHERIALESELAQLEQSWKDAEEIAGIADHLALPSGVESSLADLRRRHESGTS